MEDRVYTQPRREYQLVGSFIDDLLHLVGSELFVLELFGWPPRSDVFILTIMTSLNGGQPLDISWWIL